MQSDIQHELLELDQFCARAVPRLPPLIGSKGGILLGPHRDACRMAFHQSIEDASHTPGVVLGSNEDHGPECVLVAPRRKHLAFAVRASFFCGNLHDLRYAEPSQLLNLPRRRILVGKSSANELEILSTRGIRKNRNPRRNAAMDEIRGFENPCTARMRRYDDDVGRSERLVGDERSSCSSQTPLANGRYRNNNCRSQYDGKEHRTQSRPAERHGRIELRLRRPRAIAFGPLLTANGMPENA